MAGHVETFTNSMVFLQFNEQMNICCDQDIDFTEVNNSIIQIFDKSDSFTEVNVFVIGQCKNIMKSFEPDTDKATRGNDAQY